MPKKHPKPKYERAHELSQKYGDYPALTDIFPLRGAGFSTGRDGFSLDFDAKTLLVRLEVFKLSKLKASEAAKRLGLMRPGKWNAEAAREALIKQADVSAVIKSCQYRPFDHRRIAFDAALVDRLEETTLKHLTVPGNRALVVSPAPKREAFRHSWVVGSPPDARFLSDGAAEKTLVIPLYRKTNYGKLSMGEMRNYDYDFLRELVLTMGLKCRYPDGMPKGFTPEDLFHYVYAVLSAPSYRLQYDVELRKGVPRIPLTSSMPLFKELISLGEKLTHLHLLESEELNAPRCALRGSGNNAVETCVYKNNELKINAAQSFAPVGEAVWQFQVGSRLVLQSWLKNRIGRTLPPRDVEQYLRIIESVERTFEVQRFIDLTVEKHGGWPLKREAIKQPARPWTGA